MESRKQINEIEELKLKIERLKGSTQGDFREELAKAQFKLGNIFKKDDIEKAIEAWASIQKEDSSEMFTKAQLNLGSAFHEKGDINKAIQVWELIKREDSPEQFAKAQFNLGNAFNKKGDVDKAIEAWASIQKEDSSEMFTKAQLNLGSAFNKKGDIDKAIQVWELIKREDSPEQFAKAQFNWGNAFNKKGDVDKAIEAWESIKRDDFPDAFSKAQLNLGSAFNDKGDIGKAIEAWESIKREDSPEQFAKAQFNLGNAFNKKGGVDKAIEAWASIQKEDSSEMFTKAQLNLGSAFNKKDDINKAIQAWESIKREDSPEQFAKAQFNLGNAFNKKRDVDKAIQAWESIKREDFPDAFTRAQFNLGNVFKEKGDIDKAINAFLNAYEAGDYRYNIFKDILKLDDKKLKEPLVSIFACIDEILESLKVSWEYKDFETEIAHYTTPRVGFMMLDNNEPSKFRLNTIKGVNDPEEGKVLYRYLENKLQDDELLIPFISCFTFNHDSLNQFRLYGKDSGKEASGISLVISKDRFFNQDGDIYSSINSNQSIHEELLDTRVQEETTRGYINTLSLYRCIYLDPYQKDNELYLKVSHRDEWTFYRENNNEDISSRWEEYQVKIKDIEDNVRANLAKIKEFFIKIKGDKQAVNIAEKIVLPLRYLIKHAAFREEQECRIIYVSDVCDEKIKVDNEKSQMYIEYGCDLKDAIHKIYLSPGADKYKDHFRRILKDKEGKKVISSTNPFRIK